MEGEAVGVDARAGDGLVRHACEGVGLLVVCFHSVDARGEARADERQMLAKVGHCGRRDSNAVPLRGEGRSAAGTRPLCLSEAAVGNTMVLEPVETRPRGGGKASRVGARGDALKPTRGVALAGGRMKGDDSSQYSRMPSTQQRSTVSRNHALASLEVRSIVAAPGSRDSHTGNQLEQRQSSAVARPSVGMAMACRCRTRPPRGYRAAACRRRPSRGSPRSPRAYRARCVGCRTARRRSSA
jgi:hypothetical protein